MALSRGRRAAFRILGVAIVLAAIEGLSSLAIWVSRPFLVEEIRTTRDIFDEQSDGIRRVLESDSLRVLALDPLLGWRYRAGRRDSANTMNSQGLRSTRQYSPHPPRGVLRVAAFGDSFVYGNEVADSGAWPALVERLFPQVEVLNYGVGGYGTDQAYLRYCAEGAALSPRIVIIGFVPVGLRRVVNVYLRFVSNRELPLAKPRFTLGAGGELVLLPNPLPHRSDYTRYLGSPRDIVALGAHDYWYNAAIYQNPVYDYSATVRLPTNLWLRLDNRYLARDRLLRQGAFNPSSSAFRIQMALFEAFAAAVRATGAHPTVAIFPDRASVTRARLGRSTLVTPLVQELAARGIDHVDLTDAFVEARTMGDVNMWFKPGGHYSPAGNRIVALWLGKEILARAASGGPNPGALHADSGSASGWRGGCPAEAGKR